MTAITNEYKPLDLSYIKWLGFKSDAGSLVSDDIPGRIEFINNKWHYCLENNKSEKLLNVRKDLLDIVLPIKNKKIAERNALIKAKTKSNNG